MALLSGSPAIDAGDDAVLDAPLNLSTDQRGYPRLSGPHVDIGAYEWQAASLPLYLAALTRLAGGGAQLAFTNTHGGSFTILAHTNLFLPLNNWTPIGSASEFAPGQFQFTDLQATNSAQRFYGVKSP